MTDPLAGLTAGEIESYKQKGLSEHEIAAIRSGGEGKVYRSGGKVIIVTREGQVYTTTPEEYASATEGMGYERAYDIGLISFEESARLSHEQAKRQAAAQRLQDYYAEQRQPTQTELSEMGYRLSPYTHGPEYVQGQKMLYIGRTEPPVETWRGEPLPEGYVMYGRGALPQEEVYRLEREKYSPTIRYEPESMRKFLQSTSGVHRIPSQAYGPRTPTTELESGKFLKIIEESHPQFEQDVAKMRVLDLEAQTKRGKLFSEQIMEFSEMVPDFPLLPLRTTSKFAAGVVGGAESAVGFVEGLFGKQTVRQQAPTLTKTGFSAGSDIMLGAEYSPGTGAPIVMGRVSRETEQQFKRLAELGPMYVAGNIVYEFLEAYALKKAPGLMKQAVKSELAYLKTKTGQEVFKVPERLKGLFYRGKVQTIKAVTRTETGIGAEDRYISTGITRVTTSTQKVPYQEAAFLEDLTKHTQLDQIELAGKGTAVVRTPESVSGAKYTVSRIEPAEPFVESLKKSPSVTVQSSFYRGFPRAELGLKGPAVEQALTVSSPEKGVLHSVKVLETGISQPFTAKQREVFTAAQLFGEIDEDWLMKFKLEHTSGDYFRIVPKPEGLVKTPLSKHLVGPVVEQVVKPTKTLLKTPVVKASVEPVISTGPIVYATKIAKSVGFEPTQKAKSPFEVSKFPLPQYGFPGLTGKRWHELGVKMPVYPGGGVKSTELLKQPTKRGFEPLVDFKPEPSQKIPSKLVPDLRQPQRTRPVQGQPQMQWPSQKQPSIQRQPQTQVPGQRQWPGETQVPSFRFPTPGFDIPWPKLPSMKRVAPPGALTFDVSGFKLKKGKRRGTYWFKRVHPITEPKQFREVIL